MDQKPNPTRDVSQDDAIPCFMWDRNVSVGRLRAALRDPGDPQRIPLLRVLLREGPPFYLSGGAALAAGYLGHRKSLDLDLFVASADDLDALGSFLEHVAVGAGWALEEVRRFPGFRRYLLRAGAETTLVDPGLLPETDAGGPRRAPASAPRDRPGARPVP